VHFIVGSIKGLTSKYFHPFKSCFIEWTQPSDTSLLLGTVTDLVRSKSELVAENALLRQQLIILRRQDKRTACTKTDRMILVLLARSSRAWKQALFIVQPETLLRWHRHGCAALLEVQIPSSIFQTKDTPRDCCVDQGNGGAESTVGSGTNPWRVAQVRYSRV